MPRRRPLCVLVALAALLPACGDGEGDDGRATARLIVRERLPPRPVYIEGSLSFLRVERVGPGGREVVTDGAVTDGRSPRGRQPLFDRALEPGRYRIESHQRPCVGTCDQLDPPTDRCARTVALAPGATLTATVELRQRGGCTIDVRRL